jgi:hypothetical protein
MTFVELYAGMAAVSHRLRGGDPPVRYKGGKRGYSRAILASLAVPADAEIVLVEADPYVADALRVVWTPEARAEAIDLIRSWEAPEADQRARWEGWRQEAHADGWAGVPDVERGTRWLWMRPRTVAMQTPPMCNRGNWLAQKNRKNGRSEWRLDAPALNLGRLPADLRATVIRARAETIAPIPGAIAYLDPPYDGTSGYRTGAEGYPEAHAIAERWSAAGCAVGVSAAIPMRIDARALEFQGARGRAKHGTPEFLSIWTPRKRGAA